MPDGELSLTEWVAMRKSTVWTSPCTGSASSRDGITLAIHERRGPRFELWGKGEGGGGGGSETQNRKKARYRLYVASFPGLRYFRLHKEKSQGFVSKVTQSIYSGTPLKGHPLK